MKKLILFVTLIFITSFAKADDGYRLWMKYDLLKDKTKLITYSQSINYIQTESQSSIIKSATDELQMALKGLLGKTVLVQNQASANGGIVLQLLKEGSEEGFTISNQNKKIIISAKTDKGLLYGTFALIRQIQTLEDISKINLTENPKIKLRMLNHWDNVNGTIERGYAGESLWKWYDLPENISPRYKDYARALASIGINCTVVNNVNASARFMTAEYLHKVEALAKVFRPYGIKMYLSVRFSAPRNVGGLPTSDPLDLKVQQWWKDKAKEIYSIIPDFGGFLVKANSEGEPGPQDYNRTHADGANMLADAVEPFGGIVIWRAFVYAANPNGDRFKEAHREFKPLDGQFKPNVLVQVKNGPIDFMPREPFHPLFGAMPKTPLVMEYQITQEYLGFATHAVYLGTLFKEVLESDTYTKGKGSTVAKIIDGSVDNHTLTGIAGVANTGSDRNWSGHPLNQANWYAYGRLAWNHDLSAEKIADEWIKMSLTTDKQSVSTIKEIMMASRENTVNYMNPLGLHHIMGQGIHFGPEPWLTKSQRPDWTSIYYHRADSIGLGFNRTTTGSDALGLYTKEVQNQWNNPETCPLEYLLWFHHVAWNKKLSTNRTLWEEICERYYKGANDVLKYQETWAKNKNNIDPEMYEFVMGKLKVQYREALWWRDACVLYFQTFSKMPIPSHLPKPERSLEEIKKLVEIYQMR